MTYTNEQLDIEIKQTKKQADVLADILKEIRRAKSKHPGDFVSFHHAFGVYLEEHDELWDAIKQQKPNHQDIRDEAVQCCAMLVRLIVELT